MSEINYIKTKDSVTFIRDLEPPVTITSSNFLFPKVLGALAAKDLKGAFHFAKEKVASFLCPVSREEIDFESLHPCMREIHAYGRDTGQNFDPYILKLAENPDPEAVGQLFDFQMRWSMPITKDGYVLAYKGLRIDKYSVMGNTQTTVLQGKVDPSGHILNEIGAVIEILRSDVDSDPSVGCGQGIHAGSFNYAKGWGDLLTLVKIHPRDVCCVPVCTNYQKIRCCKYRVEQIQGVEITGKCADKVDGWDSVANPWDVVKTHLAQGVYSGRSVGEAYKCEARDLGLSYGPFESFMAQNADLKKSGNGTVSEWIIQ